jgi:probable HAF family extracellular repeat protein
MSIYTYSTLDDPSAAVYGSGDGTEARGINNSGQIVGYYLLAGTSSYQGFLYSNGVYTSLEDPTDGIPGDPYNRFTTAAGINDAGQIVGVFSSTSDADPIGFNPTGFLETNGLYAPIVDPLASPGNNHGTVAAGINNSGQIVGSYTTIVGGTAATYGFLLSGGFYFTLDDPSSTNDTVATGINDKGQIVGYYSNASGAHGFLYSGGTYTTLDDPLATNGSTSAWGINDLGQIVGDYSNASGTHVFLYSGGTYTTLPDDPLATNGIQPTGINDNGQIVGTYWDSNTHTHGFLLTITLPATPAAPTDSAVVNGYVNAANDTATQALTGTAENGSTVTVYDNGTPVGTTTANVSTGVWSFPIGQLADGSIHGYTVTATDTVGDVSQPSAALNFSVDTTPPTITVNQKLANDTGISHTDLITSDGHVTLSGTVLDNTGVASVEIFDGKVDLGAATISNGTWMFPTLLGEGTHALYAVATDNAGNSTTTPTQPTIVVDTTPPTPFMSDVVKNSNNNLTTLSGMSRQFR